jgi:cysteinyl-tRNA synthetase
MAKSLGNFITIKDILNKYPPDVLKIFYLQTHYSHPIDFTWEKMEEAKQAYEKIIILKNKLEAKYDNKSFGGYGLSEVIKDSGGYASYFKDRFIEYMEDDFNTPRGLSVLFDMVNRCNKLLQEDKDHDEYIKLPYDLDTIRNITDIFGLNFIERLLTEISDGEVASLITMRKHYKEEKKYTEADKIRKELEAKGIILEDTKDGTTWRRKL